MRRQSSGTMLLALLLAIVLALGGVFLQEKVFSWNRQEQSIQRRPEKSEQYNNAGLPVGQSLSAEKLYSSENLALYPDRVLSLKAYPDNGTQYTADTVASIRSACPSLQEIYLMPVPERAVLESDFPERNANYQSFVQNLTRAVGQTAVVLDPLPELAAHSEEYLFYRTDPGWTMRGAFYGNQVFRRALGYPEDSLSEYREYLFGYFLEALKSSAAAELKGTQWEDAVSDIPGDPAYLYLHPADPNRAEVTLKGEDGALLTLKRDTVALTDAVPSSILSNSFRHAIVEGYGEGVLLLITDNSGKAMIPFLTGCYGEIYVINVEMDKDCAGELDRICSERNITRAMWLQSASRMGDKSYMAALNALNQEGGTGG